MDNIKIENIKKSIKNAQDIIDIAYPTIKEGKIILKALNELGKAANSMILLLDKKESPETLKVKKIMELVERRKKSPMEFSRKNRAVIMQETLETESITPETIGACIRDLKDALKGIEISQKKTQFTQN